jgi:hypothetical protein
VAKVGTSKAGGTISQLGCDTSVACHRRPSKEEEEEGGGGEKEEEGEELVKIVYGIKCKCEGHFQGIDIERAKLVQSDNWLL